MRIKKLYATFGKLENKTLDLAPKLNVVYGENESGKSTWSAFIRAMLFGVDTRERATSDKLPDKEKYLPWSGEAMYGKLVADTENGEVVIERIAGKNGVLSKESATYPETGKSIASVSELVGVARSVYERTAYIAQSAIGVNGDAETEKRILSIASSGEENVSVVEVLRRLERGIAVIKSKNGKGGELPTLLAKKEELCDILEKSEETKQEIEETREKLKAAEEEEKILSRKMKIAEAVAVADKLAFVKNAEKELDIAKKKAEELSGYPTRGDLDKFTAIKDEWQGFELSHEKLSAELLQSTHDEEDIKDALSSSPFADMSTETARRKAEEDTKKLSEKRQEAPLGLILAVVGAALLFAVKWFIALPVIVAGVVVFILQKTKKNESAAEEISKSYGKATPEAIAEALSEYERLIAEREEIKAKTDEIKISAEREKTSRDLRRDDMLKLMSEFKIEADDVTEGEKILREKVLLREESRRALENAKIRVETLNAAKVEEVEPIEYTPDEIPGETIAELTLKITELSSRKKSLELSLAALSERIAGVSEDSIKKELETLAKREDELTLRYGAYALAMEKISEADVEIKSRFAPEIEKRASEIFSELTGGSFEIVRIKDTNFDMEVSKGVATSPKNTLTLSAGTLDELYFALRLALCEKILPETSPLPMIVDDAFVNFDDTRLHRALSYLKQKAQERQIIIFSCHKREAEYFKDDTEVNKIKL